MIQKTLDQQLLRFFAISSLTGFSFCGALFSILNGTWFFIVTFSIITYFAYDLSVKKYAQISRGEYSK